MGSLLGPQIVEGNSVTTLVNGVEIFPPMLQAIRSANLDNLSFRLNDEANINVMDSSFAAEQIRIFDADLSHSKHITYEQWRHRPFGEKLIDGFATMFGWMM